MKLRSNEPFWLVKNGVLHSYPSLRENTETDILIVGGGITGSLMAHRCIEDGYHTTLIDRREIANGSTAATTSMLQYEIDVPLYKLIDLIGEKGAVASYRACFDSIHDLGKLAKKIKSGCDFELKKSLYYAAYKKDISWLKKEFEVRKEYGFPVEWLEALDIKEKFKLGHAFGGILSERSASIDAYRFAHDVLAYNHKKGMEIYDKTDITKVNYTRNGVKVHTEHGATIQAKKIIYCTGFESTELIKDKFVDLLSTYAIVGERTSAGYEHLDDTLFWNTASPYMYLRTTDDNRLLIGGGDEKFVDTTKRDRLLGLKSKKLANYVQKILPGTEFRTDFVWAGTFGETKDGLPYIGKHPDFASTYFVLGFGGNGITFSVVGMDIISAMLKGEKHPLAGYFKFRR